MQRKIHSLIGNQQVEDIAAGKDHRIPQTVPGHISDDSFRSVNDFGILPGPSPRLLRAGHNCSNLELILRKFHFTG
jgi:hypothetical protein